MLNRFQNINLKKAAIFSGLFCAVFFKSSANDFEITSNFKEAYRNIYDLKLQEARLQLQKEKNVSGFKIYAENTADVLQILMTDDYRLKNKINSKEDERISQLENLDDNSPYKKLLLAELKFQWGILKLNNGEEVSAAWNIIKAYKLIEQNNTQFPGFLPNKKLLGLLHVLVGTTPDKYKWVTDLIGLKGDVNLGLKELNAVAIADPVFGEEASIFEAYIYSFMLIDAKISQKLIGNLHKKNPESLLINVLAIAATLKMNNALVAENYLKQKPVGNFLQLAIYQRFAGEISLSNGEYAKAEVSFKNFNALTLGKSYVKDAQQKIAFSQYLLSNETDGVKSILLIEKKGANYKEKDKLAQSFAEDFLKNKKWPNKNLLKARLYFDGGNFKSALEEFSGLTEKNFLISEEKAEFYYRLGRIFEQSEQPSKALDSYKRCILLSEKLEVYYGANASLYVGYMLKSTNPALAKTYFLKAISFKKHPYKTSIDAKAKAALNTMK